MLEKGRKTILVVDDDRLVRVTIVAALEGEGYGVIEADSGEDAMLIALTRPVDLAIVDIRMEGMSGIELARELKARTTIPVLFLTAYGESALVKEAIDEGALGYLLKPVDATQLLPAIETAFARWREMQSLREAQVRMSAELAGAREVSVATGIVMERRGVDRNEAFALLRGHARSSRRKLRDVAAEVVSASETVNLAKQG